jgi:hypothetical protein
MKTWYALPLQLPACFLMHGDLQALSVSDCSDGDAGRKESNGHWRKRLHLPEVESQGG